MLYAFPPDPPTTSGLIHTVAPSSDPVFSRARTARFHCSISKLAICVLLQELVKTCFRRFLSGFTGKLYIIMGRELRSIVCSNTLNNIVTKRNSSSTLH
eukprot:UN04482